MCETEGRSESRHLRTMRRANHSPEQTFASLTRPPLTWNVGQTAMEARTQDTLTRFSRDAFERSENAPQLCSDLVATLVPRLVAASDRLGEARAIADDLRAAGHELWSWDESFDFSIWGDEYVRPTRPTRFLIEMRWPSEDEPAQTVEVVVTFGPWPQAHT